MNKISLEEILSCNVGDLINILYQHLKEKNATKDDVAEIDFGNNNFECKLIIQLK